MCAQRVFHFGHGKSYKKSSATRRAQLFTSPFQHLAAETVVNFVYEMIDIDAINNELAVHCPHLTELGIFYRQSELKFKKDSDVELVHTLDYAKPVVLAFEFLKMDF